MTGKMVRREGRGRSGDKSILAGAAEEQLESICTLAVDASEILSTSCFSKMKGTRIRLPCGVC